MIRKIFFLSAVLLVSLNMYAQKVGLVFSGGGAKGLSHIGVLKALEENHIPIDYIVGTSMGGIVGGMYAAGYSPSQIEEIALSNDFQNWVSGRYSSDYHYYFKKKPDNPSILTAKLQVDTGFHAKIRSNLINDIPLNFALLELVAQPSANARGDFDKLFVPFRCIVSDVLSQKSIPVSKGSLMEAMRGTMTVPLVYRPIKVDDKYVFDGGLYDNFPVDVMKKDFSPEYIIGVNVSSKVFNDYPKDNDEKLMNRFLIYMFLSKSDSTSIGENGSYIQPDLSDFSVTNFTEVKELIRKGYEATIAEMPAIKKAVSRRINDQDLEQKRINFIQKNPPLTFKSISVTGINSKQQEYVKSVFRSDTTFITLQDIKTGYYKLVSDDNFETVYPRISYNPKKDLYDFELQVQPQKNFIVDFGGNISTRPISNIYLGLQYNYLRKQSYTFSANFYSGRFYESAQTGVRMDIPTKIPIFLEAEFTYNHWDYYSTSEIFVENASPTYIEESDRNVVLRLGIPVSSNGKIVAHSGFINFNEKYSPTNNFQTGDELDYTSFNGFNAGLSIEKNTLNRKQYATKGLSFLLSFDLYNGDEKYIPGNILRSEPVYPTLKTKDISREWFKAKLSTEQYILSRKHYSLGYLLEGVISNKPVFSTFKSTVLSAPAFYPLQDSKSLYLERLHATTYGAFGLKNIVKLSKNLDFRIEGYIFQPLEEFQKGSYQSTGFSELLSVRHYAATGGVVYHSPVGPLSLSLNHYDDPQKRYGVIFHAGFLIYNKRSYE